eukprot:TRINITY_DN1379_c0_g1_i1.p1 TRINITY_DN1379_c0_g1~~TRINITY_DN1379_c0_g1_i1.p1  ORF type:complete len:139 (-),score=38.99 TRINITY_DN1379_c0_g1_i1:228-644(-)
MWLSDNYKIGILLSGFGLFFTFSGVLLFFDRGLLAIGNLLFLSGVTMLIGFKKTFALFFHKNRLRSSIPFLGGIFLVLIGWPFFGMIIETYGFFHLFGTFFPMVISSLSRMPIIGQIFCIPGVKQITDRIIANGKLPV